MNILIIEDEPAAARRLEKMLKDIDAAVAVAANCDSISSAVRWFNANAAPDLIFMDVQLADGLSFEIFKQVSITSPVVFATAYDAYAIQAFKTSGIDYLLKPIDASELRRSIEKFKRLNAPYSQGTAAQVGLGTLSADIEAALAAISKKQPTYRTRFLVEHKGRFSPIAVGDVAYIYSEHKLTSLVTREAKKFLMPQTLEELESELNPSEFFRANRQFIVSASAVKSVHAHFGGKLLVELAPPAPDEVFISREKAGSFKAWLDR